MSTTTQRFSGAGRADAAAMTTAAATRARIRGWLEAIDPTLSTATFDTLWQRAGTTDAERADALREALVRLLPDAPASTAAGDALLDAFVADPAHRANVVATGDLGSAALAALGRSDAGARIALANADAFALVGNRALFAQLEPSLLHDRFSPDTGERLIADSWLDDRAKFVAWSQATAAERAGADTGGAQWTFIDHAAVAGEAAAGFTVGTAAEATPRHQLAFGSAAADMLRGGAGTDRLHGDGGDDVLRGGAGGDLLDGGPGEDLLLGGAGGDDLDGGPGDDELEGGRGDDRLQGGRGDDTYVVATGGGSDIVVDSDGVGTLVWDDEALHGEAQAAGDGTWTLAAGRYRLAVDGDPATGATLTIRLADADDPTTVRVEGWHSGDLGIRFATGADTGTAAAVLAPDIDAATPAVPDTVSADGLDAAMADTTTVAAGVAAAALPVEAADVLDMRVDAPSAGGDDVVSFDAALADWQDAYARFLADFDTEPGLQPLVPADVAAAVSPPSTAEATAISLALEGATLEGADVAAVAGAADQATGTADAGAFGVAAADVAAALAGIGNALDDPVGAANLDGERWARVLAALFDVAANVEPAPMIDRPTGWTGVALPPALLR